MIQRPFTPAELAERWACSERHVRGLISKGALSAFRVGHLWRMTTSGAAHSGNRGKERCS